MTIWMLLLTIFGTIFGIVGLAVTVVTLMEAHDRRLTRISEEAHAKELAEFCRKNNFDFSVIAYHNDLDQQAAKKR